MCIRDSHYIGSQWDHRPLHQGYYWRCHRCIHNRLVSSLVYCIFLLCVWEDGSEQYNQFIVQWLCFIILGKARLIAIGPSTFFCLVCILGYEILNLFVIKCRNSDFQFGFKSNTAIQIFVYKVVLWFKWYTRDSSVSISNSWTACLVKKYS